MARFNHSGAGNSYNGTAINRLARLNADGSLDASFNSGSGPDWSIEKIVVQSNGKILIAGSFVTVMVRLVIELRD